MDTDFIVTGNIAELWNHFDNMNDHQLVGLIGNNQPETLPVKYKLTNCFRNSMTLKILTFSYNWNRFFGLLIIQSFLFYKEVPFMPPAGLNSGLLLMNLTKMRRYGFEDKVSTTFKDSRRASLDDQTTLNVLLYNDPGR